MVTDDCRTNTKSSYASEPTASYCRRSFDPFIRGILRTEPSSYPPADTMLSQARSGAFLQAEGTPPFWTHLHIFPVCYVMSLISPHFLVIFCPTKFSISAPTSPRPRTRYKKIFPCPSIEMSHDSLEMEVVAFPVPPPRNFHFSHIGRIQQFQYYGGFLYNIYLRNHLLKWKSLILKRDHFLKVTLTLKHSHFENKMFLGFKR